MLVFSRKNLIKPFFFPFFRENAILAFLVLFLDTKIRGILAAIVTHKKHCERQKSDSNSGGKEGREREREGGKQEGARQEEEGDPR